MRSQLETDETFVGSMKAGKPDTSLESSFVKMASGEGTEIGNKMRSWFRSRLGCFRKGEVVRKEGNILTFQQ
jgi:hypothetical protein